MVVQVNEMAYKRTDAIDRCYDLGKKFTEHFRLIVKLGKEDIDFKHHCQELQAWYDKVKNIKLKETKKFLRISDLWDWFFTVGQSIEDVIPEEQYQDIYEKFYLELSKGESTVYEILSELLKEESESFEESY